MIHYLKLWGQFSRSALGLQVKWMQKEILQRAQEINDNNNNKN